MNRIALSLLAVASQEVTRAVAAKVIYGGKDNERKILSRLNLGTLNTGMIAASTLIAAKFPRMTLVGHAVALAGLAVLATPLGDGTRLIMKAVLEDDEEVVNPEAK